MEQLGNDEEEKRRTRRPNFTSNEIEALLSGYEKRKNIFLPKLSSSLTTAMKRRSWASLLREVNATSSNCRTVDELKRKMKDMKKISKQKVSLYKWQLEETRSSPAESDALDPVTQRVVEIIGEKSIIGIDRSLETSIGGASSNSSNPELNLDTQVDINDDESSDHTVESIRPSSSKNRNAVSSRSTMSVTQELNEELTKTMADRSSLIMLKCENHHQALTAALWNFLQSKHGADLDVEWGGHLIRVHRLILDVFLSADKLLETVAETGRQQPHDGQDLGSLLKFLYQGKVVVSKDSLENLMQIAKKSNFKLLVDALESAEENSTSEIIHQGNQKGWQSDEDNRGASWKLELDGIKFDTNFEKTAKVMASVDSVSDQEIPDDEDWRPSSDSSDNDNEYNRSDASVGKNGVKGKTRASSSHHRRLHKQQQERYKCSKCHRSYTTRSSLYKHERISHSGNKPLHTCDFCNESFSSKDHLKSHCREIHSHDPLPKLFSCDVCGKQFRQRRSLTDHIRCVHNGEKRAKPKAFRFKNGNRMCEICGQMFTSTYYYTHMAMHKYGKPVACGYCPKTFFNVTQQKIHERIHTGQKPFKCGVCDRSFRQSSQARRHVQSVHSEKVAHTCSHCPKTYYSREEMRRHLRLHTGENLFRCDFPGCQRVFTQLSRKAIHFLTHCPDRPMYSCSVCDKSFTRMDNLRSHQSTHMHGRDIGH